MALKRHACCFGRGKSGLLWPRSGSPSPAPMPSCAYQHSDGRFSLIAATLNGLTMQAFADAVQVRRRYAWTCRSTTPGRDIVAHFHDTPREAWLHEAELKLFCGISPVQAVSAFAGAVRHRFHHLRELLLLRCSRRST
ncbi:hypothetical protein KIF59_15690 [Enterobacter cloacae subsp. cloacae]|nr:hypothetical protein [Enterobacter cloacae subsp. cloacae]